ncbi:amidohydrolase family protein [Fischerella sp. JS2]|uniref:amidohydrolase family protein n=1 Tax=Fischerella sp. JS2 TaxID=2597771 RepID=UPI0028F12CDC|nr:amidohydrolase family protein [Fischerella sp. JS2]
MIAHENGQHYNQYILPGFIDAHVHTESSMLISTVRSLLVWLMIPTISLDVRKYS